MKRFTLKPEHITLLSNAYVSWWSCEFGAPAIDCKRPYGNGNVLDDMAEILGYTLFEDAWGKKHLSKEQHDELQQLHNETRTALQIVLCTQSFEPGVYEADDYEENWRRVKP